MSWRTKKNENLNGNAFEKFFNNKKNNEKLKETNSESKEKNNNKPLSVQIKELEDILNSGKYMSKVKKKTLEEKLEKLKKDKENEFPDLIQPTVFINTPQRSIWLNSLDKVKSNDGMDELNEKMKKIYAEENAERAKIKEEKRLKRLYKKYNDKEQSDYEKDDFY